jgi:hypothetical protein
MITADETNETNRDITRKNSAPITFIDNADSETPADFPAFQALDLPSDLQRPGRDAPRRVALHLAPDFARGMSRTKK